MTSDLEPNSLESYFQKQIGRIESELERILPSPSQHPSAEIHEAMRYSVLNGGKRIRPLLCLAVCDMLGGSEDEALVPACSIELIHSYSLVHDDLPCMDNDEFRRGKPTCHKKFGEALALLAGDGLLTLSFELLASLKDAQKTKRLLNEISKAAGTFGMVGGQVMELITNPNEIDLLNLEAIHIQKTGQLIKTSCLAGAIVAGAKSDAEHHILRFGEYLGFAFQIVDDILDGDGFLRFMSAHEARNKAAEVIEKGKQELKNFQNGKKLFLIADFILRRGNREV